MTAQSCDSYGSKKAPAFTTGGWNQIFLRPSPIDPMPIFRPQTPPATNDNKLVGESSMTLSSFLMSSNIYKMLKDTPFKQISQVNNIWFCPVYPSRSQYCRGLSLCTKNRAPHCGDSSKPNQHIVWPQSRCTWKTGGSLSNTTMCYQDHVHRR